MRSRFLDILAVSPLLAAALVFMLPLADGGFLTDDFHNIRFATYGPEGKTAFDPDAPSEVLKYFHTKATDRYELYRPLVPLSFRASYEWSGTNPRPYIITNIVLHLLGGLTALSLLRTLFPTAGRLALLAAVALFLFSPLQTQVAYWSSARSDSLCWLFGSLALSAKWHDRRSMILPLLLAALSMLSKEAGLVFLGLVGFCDCLPEDIEDRSGWGRLPRIIGVLAVGAAYVALRSWIFGGLAMDNAYGSEDFLKTLRENGLDNLKTGLLTALAPVPALIIPHDALRWSLRVVLGAGSAWLIVGGLWKLRARGLPRLLLIAALLVGPFVMAGLVSRLDERFINTRGCYIPVFALSALLAVLTNSGSRRRWLLAVLLLAANLPVAWQLQKHYVVAARETDHILSAMRRPLEDVDTVRYPNVAILNFQHITWFRGGFSAAGCLQPALMRPFVPEDLSSRLVLLDKKDHRAFLTPMAEAFTPDDATCVLEMKLRTDKTWNFRLLHPRENKADAVAALTAVYPARDSEVELDLDEPESLVPSYTVRHSGAPAARYRVCLFNAKGRVVDTVALVDEATTADGFTEVRLKLPRLSPEMARDHEKPKHMAWSVYAEEAGGSVTHETPLVPFVVSLKSR